MGTADVLQELHYVSRGEEMGSHHLSETIKTGSVLDVHSLDVHSLRAVTHNLYSPYTHLNDPDNHLVHLIHLVHLQTTYKTT